MVPFANNKRDYESGLHHGATKTANEKKEGVTSDDGARGGEERRGWMLVSGKQPARKFHCAEFSHFASAPLMSTVRSLALQVREKPNRVSFDCRSSFAEREEQEKAIYVQQWDRYLWLLNSRSDKNQLSLNGPIRQSVVTSNSIAHKTFIST